jgi:hypothetical protein
MDDIFRERLTENAFNEIILSGKYSYTRFTKQFDSSIRNAGDIPYPVYFL